MDIQGDNESQNEDMEIRMRERQGYITVIVPVYNVEKYLEQCLDSIVVGNVNMLGMLEVIVIDDGSPDQSGKIAEQYAVLRFEVKDTGIGIKEEDLARIIEPFERADEVRNRKLEGTGLGMSIIVNLLKMMDSEINIESVYNEGSCFWFELKARISDPKPSMLTL